MPEPVSRSVGAHIAVASAFMIALRLSFRLIGLVSTVILARLLTPADFGLVALATMFQGSLDMLSDLSLQAALIRLKVIDRSHLDTVWTLGILRGLIIGGLLAVAAAPVASLLNDPRLQTLILILAATAVVQGWENVGVVQFKRDMQFDKIFAYQISGKVVMFAVCIPLAFALRSYWALISAIVAARVFLVLYSYRMSDYRPWFSLACVRQLFHFSKWLVLSNLLWAIDGYTPALLFGRIGGPAATGLYQVSAQIGSLPASEIAAPIREPIYAGLAKLLGNEAALRSHFVEGFALLLLIIVPTSTGLALTAELITPLFLGPQWGDTTSLIPLCAFYALFDAIGHYTHNLFVLLNRQRGFVATFAAVQLVRFPLVVYVAFRWGMNDAVVALLATAMLNAVVWLARVAPLLHLKVLELVGASWRTPVAALAMAGFLLAFFPSPGAAPIPGGGAAEFLETVLSGAAVFAATHLALWLASGRPAGVETQFARILSASLARLAAALRASRQFRAS